MMLSGSMCWETDGFALVFSPCVDCLDDIGNVDRWVEIPMSDIGKFGIGDSVLRESVGDCDLGVEFGERVVESYVGKVLSSEDSKGGVGVSILDLNDTGPSSISELFDDSIDVV